MRCSGRLALCSIVLAALAACSGTGITPPASTTFEDVDSVARAAAPLVETWTEFPSDVLWLDGSSDGRWIDQWDGYGSIDVVSSATASALELTPQAGIGTHSALVTSAALYANFSATVPITTRAQVDNTTYPWEVGWLLWHYHDNTHFYAFVPKPNGWELDKEDPAYPGSQHFLATGSTPTFPIGSSSTITVVQVGGRMTVSVNGVQICRYDDRDRPYLTGAIGLYTEEARVDIGTVTAKPI